VKSDLDQTLLNEVSTMLWRERQLLELLLFKLEEEQLVLAASKPRWLHHATREVEMVLDQLKRAELLRSIKVDEVAAMFGLEPSPTLQHLADVADEPWRTIFSNHRQAFILATEEIRHLADGNRELLARGQKATRDALAWLTSQSGDPAAYTSAGAMAHAAPGPHLINETL